MSSAIEDVALAIEEFGETTKIESLALVGLRLGAAIALCSATAREDVAEVVLWDPVLSGPAYLTEMLAEVPNLSTTQGHGIDVDKQDGIWGFNGFPVTPDLRQELEKLDLTDVAVKPTLPVNIISSQDRPEYQKFLNDKAGDLLLHYKHIPSHGDWNDIDDYGGALLHSEIVREIVNLVDHEQ